MTDKELIYSLMKKGAELTERIQNACRDAIDEIVNLFEGLDITRIEVEDWACEPDLYSTGTINHVVLDEGTIYVYPDIGEDVEYTSEDWFDEAPQLLQILTQALSAQTAFLEKLTVGAKVKWNDPAINDYEPEERTEALKREFEIFKVPENLTVNDSVWISDGHTEAEVPIWELEIVL